MPLEETPSGSVVARIRNMPLTIGLVILGIGALFFGVDRLNAHEERTQAQIQRNIAAHNVNDGAHPGLRRALHDMEGRMTRRVERIGADVKELRSDVKKLLMQPRPRRRGRR